MADDDLYTMRVSSNVNGEQLVAITGSRETVLDVALRVMLDAAPRWDDMSAPRYGIRPTFAVDVDRVTRRGR